MYVSINKSKHKNTVKYERIHEGKNKKQFLERKRKRVITNVFFSWVYGRGRGLFPIAFDYIRTTYQGNRQIFCRTDINDGGMKKHFLFFFLFL